MKVAVAWSGGKDSALALHRIMGKHEVHALLTTITKPYSRVTMHGVRKELIKMQADSMGIPLEEIVIPPRCPDELYRRIMSKKMRDLIEKGVEAIVFGDIFLEDVRRFREENLKEVGMNGMFPLWGEDTWKLSREFLQLGFKAIITCIDPRRLSPEDLGKQYSLEFIENLPDNVDPCGENGEFHTFVYQAPYYKKGIEYRLGRKVQRDGFWWIDLIPEPTENQSMMSKTRAETR